MTNAAMWVPPAATAILWAGGGHLGRSLPPATAVRLLTAAMLITSLTTGFVLSIVYVIGMAITYALAGIAAGLLGTMLSAVPVKQ